MEERGVCIQAVYLIVLYGFMILIVIHDIKERKIYNSILIFMILSYISLCVIGSIFFNSSIFSKNNIIAAFIICFLFFLMKIMSPSGIGMGDVKLVFVLGLYLGDTIFEVVMLSLVCMLVYSQIYKKRTRNKKGIPYAPFIFAAMMFYHIFISFTYHNGFMENYK